MGLPNLGGATTGGTITEGQDDKEDTSNALDALLDNSMNASNDFSVTAGGTLNLNTPQGNLDIYLGNGLILLTGSPGAPTTIIVPDGDRRIAFANVSGQATTIDTVTGASSPVAIPDGNVKAIHIHGTDMTVIADDATQTGALLADGTVAATGDFDWADNVIGRAELKDYSETKTAPAAAATIDLDLENGNVFAPILDQNTTFTFSNPPASGVAGSFTLIIDQGAGGFTVTMPASVVWEEGDGPAFSTTASAVDMVSFLTIDGGTTWYGFLGGLDFS